MKQTLFFLLIVLPVINAASQVVEEADSLLNLLHTRKNKSIEELTLYKELCMVYAYNDNEKSGAYARKGIELAGKYNEKRYLMWFTTALAESYSSTSVYDTALIYFNKAVELAEKAEDEAYLAWIHLNLANTYTAMNMSETALEYYLKAMPYTQENDMYQYATILTNIGVIHRGLNNYDRAIHYLNMADSLNAALDYDYGKMYAKSELGIISMKQGEYDKAREYLEESVELSRAANDKSLELVILQVLAMVYSNGFSDYEKAMQTVDLSLKIALEYGDKRLISGSWGTKSSIYRKMKQYKETEATAIKSWELDSTYFDSGYNMLDNILWANIFLGNKAKASDYLDKMNAFVLDHITKNPQNILLDMETKYETEKKELRIAALEKEKQLYIWLGIAGVLLAVALGIALRQKIKSTRKEKLLIATRSVLDGEMSERTRLARDLHDRLSGNLSAVKIGLNKNTESLQNVYDKLDSCIEEVRRVAHNLMPTSLQFGLKVALEDFVAQFPNVHFHFFGEERRMEERKEFIIYCCANELVNNSIRHSGAKNINLQLVQDERSVVLTVQDDGCGFDEKSVVQGIGLKNIRDRVASCNGKIDIITSPGKGTETMIELKTANIE